jgi:hypothetical protein
MGRVRTTTPGLAVATALALLLALLLAACGGPDEPTTQPSPAAASQDPESSESGHGGHSEGDAEGHGAGHGEGHGGTTAAADTSRPLRAGEERVDLEMPQSYTPSAPNGVGTDDYRCFLLDPDLAEDRFLTGTDVRPGNADVVHHVILFQVPPEAVGTAEQTDAASPGPGWTCFGDMGVQTGPNLDDAPWLAAWAPGGEEQVRERGYGVRLEEGARVVMQVHYNLLAGNEPDRSAVRLRLARPGAALEEVSTMLLPAPVELPCRPDRDDSPLCDRQAALADVKERFGEGPGSTADLLHLLCATPVAATSVSRCDRTIQRPTTIMAAAGHMHLLGRSLTLEVNPGTPRARTVLDIPVWNFDDQGARAVDPVRLQPGDEVRVTCRHSQQLRDEIPALQDSEERYGVWGEGTTDEMCLGILQVTYP